MYYSPGQRPGRRSHTPSIALKGQVIRQMMLIIRPFRASWNFQALCPRALPWAILPCPFRANSALLKTSWTMHYCIVSDLHFACCGKEFDILSLPSHKNSPRLQPGGMTLRPLLPLVRPAAESGGANEGDRGFALFPQAEAWGDSYDRASMPES